MQKSSAPKQVFGMFERMSLNCQNTAKKCQIRIKTKNIMVKRAPFFGLLLRHIYFKPTKIVGQYFDYRSPRSQEVSPPSEVSSAPPKITCTDDLATLKPEAVETV